MQQNDSFTDGYRQMASAAACDAACVQPACAAWTFGAVVAPPSPSPHPCPREFPYPNTKPHSFDCYNNETYAKKGEGPCGSWCVDCAGDGYGCGPGHLCSTANITKGCPPPPPGPPGSKAGPGVDLHGGDLKGMPVQLNGTDNETLAASEKACAALCAGRNYPGAAPDERCVAWVINVPGCVSAGHSSWKAQECFLKAGGEKPQMIRNKCRISGLVAKATDGTAAAAGSAADVEVSAEMCTLHALIPVPPIIKNTSSSCGHYATKLMLNNKPAPFLAGILSQGL